MITVPLYTGFCPDRWKQVVAGMIEKIPGVQQQQQKANNNDANNEQWQTDGSKKNNIGILGDSKNKAGHNGIYSNEGERGLHTQSLKPGGEKCQLATSTIQEHLHDGPR
jgi:hypothetical protein